MPRTPANKPNSASEPTEPVPTTAPVAPANTEPTVVYVPAPSYLDRVRQNRMGPLTAALVVGALVGLLLSMLVPNPSNVWALILLGALVSAAVGFTVRYLSVTRSWRAQVPALIGAVLGVHIMSVTGTLQGIGSQSIAGMIKISGPGFNDALLGALATPAVATGTVLAGLVAAIIAGWGPRDEA